jgi:peptidoglycan hydrolase-like protein with peptidoglycan-binding domain
MQEVKATQRVLQEKGTTPVDRRVHGSRTREALKSFQTASGLETTGTLNQATAEKLDVDLGLIGMFLEVAR